MPSRCSCQIGQQRQWELPGTDSNGTDGSEDRIDSDRADDSTDSDGADGSDYRSDGNTAERNRVPDPTDAAVSKIRRGA